MIFLAFLSGFIDFIVNPTMTVLGDVLDAILKPLDYGRRPVAIDNTESSNSLYRPWTDILAVNKQEWTAKHDAGSIIHLHTIQTI